MDFNCFSHYYVGPYVPKKELWLDYENVPGEREYYITHMLVERRLMGRGMCHKEAHTIARGEEQKQRSASALIRKMKTLGPLDIAEKIHKEKIDFLRGHISVWIVGGELVRGLHFIDFTMGGHDKVYDFVPENEIWIDDDVVDEERDFVLLHELHERNLMARGMDYPHAHESANKVEFLCRQQPSVFDKYFKTEEAIAVKIDKY